ncbi:uncharacterized protein BO72DRAFT_448412, partial [Aspergillus fijiensis CBS 313.89]
MRFLSCVSAALVAIFASTTFAVPINGGVNCTQLEQQIVTLQQGVSTANGTNPEGVQAAQQLLYGARLVQATECTNSSPVKRFFPPTGPLMEHPHYLRSPDLTARFHFI